MNTLFPTSKSVDNLKQLHEIQRQIILSSSYKALDSVVPVSVDLDEVEIDAIMDDMIAEFPKLYWVYSRTGAHRWSEHGIMPLIVPSESDTLIFDGTIPSVNSLKDSLHLTLKQSCKHAEAALRRAHVIFNQYDTATADEVKMEIDCDTISQSILKALLQGYQPLVVPKLGLVSRFKNYIKSKLGFKRKSLPSFIIA